MSFYGLTDDERKELADLIGGLAVFFTEAAHAARAERDAAVRRADEAERRLRRLTNPKPDGDVLATKVSP